MMTGYMGGEPYTAGIPPRNPFREGDWPLPDLHFDEADSQPFRDRLHAVRHLELVVDVLEVRPNGRSRDPEHRSGLAVGETLREEADNLDLACGQRPDRRLLAKARPGPLRWRRRRPIFRDAEVPEQPPREIRLDDASAGVHFADGVDHLLAGRPLEEISRRAGLHGLDDFLLLVENGEDEHLDRRPAPLHLARDVDAAHARQPEVLEHHVGPLLLEQRQGGLAGERRADYLDPS